MKYLLKNKGVLSFCCYFVPIPRNHVFISFLGSYFARDASYSHAYCQPAVKTNTMFVARVLVGDYVRGNAAYVRPPTKSVDGLRFYDSCVDNELNPSIFVVFEKYQIYPEYIIEYKAEEEKCVVS